MVPPPFAFDLYEDGWFSFRPKPYSSLQQQSLDYEVEAAIDLFEAFHGTRRQLVSDQPYGFLPRYVEVDIPAGADTGMRLQAPGLGRRGIGTHGNLVIRVVVAAHPRLCREGDDLYTEVSVPLTTAVLGGSVEVEGIAEKARLKVPPMTTEEQLFHFEGLGMTSLRSSRRGDFHVLTKVQLPERLDAHQQQLFETLRQSGY